MENLLCLAMILGLALPVFGAEAEGLAVDRHAGAHVRTARGSLRHWGIRRNYFGDLNWSNRCRP